MRAILALVAILSGAGAIAETEIYPENRPIANAAYILKHTNIFSSTKLDILSTDRAVLMGGQDAPVLIARLDNCTFGIKARGTTGYKIDFSKIYGNYALEQQYNSTQIVFSGEFGVACFLNEGRPDDCRSEARIYQGDPARQNELLASVFYIMNQVCPKSLRTQPRPRY